MPICRFPTRFLKAITIAFLLQTTWIQASGAANERIPEPNPPKIERQAPEAPSAEAAGRFMAPSAATTEWTFHKTADNLHPDGNEQQLLWLANRARSDPAQEGAWLATEDDPDIVAAVNYWGVNLTVLQDDFAAIPAKPPVAFDVRLYNAAKAHSDYLISIDGQTHDGQSARVTAAGFDWTSWAGIVFSYSEHTVYGHAAFNIDWGPGTYGMQEPPGHREAIMSVNFDYTSVGYAVVPESDSATDVGPQVITGNFCYADTSAANHYNLFLVGTVWADSNGNDQYDPGEGIPGVTVEPDQGTYYAVTADSGGYAIPITSAGTYEVTFSGSTITTPLTRTVTVSSTSVLLDLKYIGSDTLPEAQTASANPIEGDSALIHGTVVPNDTSVDYHFEYGATTAYGSATPVKSAQFDKAVYETIAGLTPGTTYHYRLVATNASGTSYGVDQSFQTAAASSGSNGGGGGGGGFCLIATANEAAGWTSASWGLIVGVLGACLMAVQGRKHRGPEGSVPRMRRRK